MIKISCRRMLKNRLISLTSIIGWLWQFKDRRRKTSMGALCKSDKHLGNQVRIIFDLGILEEWTSLQGRFEDIKDSNRNCPYTKIEVQKVYDRKVVLPFLSSRSLSGLNSSICIGHVAIFKKKSFISWISKRNGKKLYEAVNNNICHKFLENYL